MSTNSELSELLHRACHDLRTPLRAVRTHAELLQRQLKGGQTPAADIDRSLGFILDGAGRAHLMVDAIAAYASALQISPNTFLPTSAGVMLRSALAKLDGDIKSASAEVTYGDLPRVRANPDRLAELFERLLRNVLEHGSAKPPRVHVSAEAVDGMWIFTFQDNGSGVEADSFETIFRPFERLHGKGPGMGLATCRAIVEGHGGKIWAEAPADGGFAIRFTLPV
jgi:signal transduction histidine kinase